MEKKNVCHHEVSFFNIYWALQKPSRGAQYYTHFEDEETEPHISLVANRDHTNSRWQACGGLEPWISPYSTISCGTVKFSQFFKTVVLCLGRHQQHPEGWLKHRWLGLTPQLTRSRLGLRICTSEKLPDDADAACLGATLWEPLPEEINSSESQSKKYIQWP